MERKLKIEDSRGEMINGMSHLAEILEQEKFERNGTWVDLINSTFLKISLRCYVYGFATVLLSVNRP